MNEQQTLINERCDSDRKRFEADFDEAVTEGRIGSVQWNDLLVHAATLPELKQTAHGLIKIYLGYLPMDNVLMPFEPYLRALVHHYWQGSMERGDFLDQVEDHIKLIRNADMKHNKCLTYDEAIYRNYEETYLPYGYAVRHRLSQFLGYEPPLEHSLIAELWLRDIMADDKYKMPNTITADDIRAITLIKYRDVLLNVGKDAADASTFWPKQ